MKSFTGFVKQVGERKQANYENCKQGRIQVVHENVHPSSTCVSYVRNPAKKISLKTISVLFYVVCSFLFINFLLYFLSKSVFTYSSDNWNHKTLPFYWRARLKSSIIYASHLKRKYFFISLEIYTKLILINKNRYFLITIKAI